MAVDFFFKEEDLERKNQIFYGKFFLNDRKKWIFENKFSVAIFERIGGNEEKIVFCFDHYESDRNDEENLIRFLNTENKFIVSDLKSLSHFKKDLRNFRDADKILNENGIRIQENEIRFFEKTKYVPVGFLIEETSRVKNALMRCKKIVWDDYDKFIWEKMIFILNEIEKNGIKINEWLLTSMMPDKKRWLTRNGFLHGRHNVYTSTSRPTYGIGGINFSALKKNSFMRKMIISRYGRDGLIVNFDYVSFHPYLIKKMTGASIEDDGKGFYVWLAKRLFKKENVSAEEVNAAKKKTFFALYGDAEDDNLKKIDFFRICAELKNSIWKEYLKNGWIKIPKTSKKIKIDGAKKSLVFNYYMQGLETAVNYDKMEEITKALHGLKTKLIMYCYDSFVFDWPINEKGVLEEIRKILEKDGFKVRIATGKNFNDLKETKL